MADAMQIKKSQYLRLKRIADAEQTTVSEIIEELIEAYEMPTVEFVEAISDALDELDNRFNLKQ